MGVQSEYKTRLYSVKLSGEQGGLDSSRCTSHHLNLLHDRLPVTSLEVGKPPDSTIPTKKKQYYSPRSWVRYFLYFFCRVEEGRLGLVTVIPNERGLQAPIHNPQFRRGDSSISVSFTLEMSRRRHRSPPSPIVRKMWSNLSEVPAVFHSKISIRKSFKLVVLCLVLGQVVFCKRRIK